MWGIMKFIGLGTLTDKFYFAAYALRKDLKDTSVKFSSVNLNMLYGVHCKHAVPPEMKEAFGNWLLILVIILAIIAFSDFAVPMAHFLTTGESFDDVIWYAVGQWWVSPSL